MSTPFAPEEYPLLAKIINETYTDEIDEILQAREEDNGDFLVLARDGAKLLAIKITDETILIRIINPDDLDGDDAEPPEDLAARAAPDITLAQGDDEPTTPELYLQQMRRKVPTRWGTQLNGNCKSAANGLPLLDRSPLAGEPN